MPEIVDPETILPDAAKNVKPSQVILWLLYPVVFALGLIIGLAIGIKQGQSTNTNSVKNQNLVNSSVIPNANTRVNTNTVNANTNTSNVFFNTNALTNGDYLRISAATQAQLDSAQQQEIDRVVDQTASVTDIVRQRDLIGIKYALKAYFSIRQNYPTTSGQQIHIEAKEANVLYQALRDFYGGTYNMAIDPESPTYYYAYTSDGQTFSLSAYLTSKKKAFTLSSTK